MPPQDFRPLLEAETRKAGLGLTRTILDRLEGHYRLLVKWNRAVRLAGDVDPQVVVRRHFMESLALLPLIHEPRGSLLDIGSGNGFPAIPIKCVLTDLRVGMLEPTLRKSVFLATVAQELKLKECEVTRSRVDRPQDLARLGRWDCITMRAVAAIPAVLAGAPSALRPQGRVLFMVGEAGRAEILRRLAAPLELVTCQPLANADASYLVVIGLSSSTSNHAIH